MIHSSETIVRMNDTSFHIILERSTDSGEEALAILTESIERDPKTIVSLTIYSKGVPLSMRGPAEMIQSFLRESLNSRY